MRYVSERGKIVPSRITAVSAKKQRELPREMFISDWPRSPHGQMPITSPSI